MTIIGKLQEMCLEAIETTLNTPGRVGPSIGSGYWPEHLRWYSDLDGLCRPIPTAHQIAQCDLFTSWVNKLPSEKERRQIWQWGFLKVRQDRTIRGYCEKLGLKEHQYRREITAIFQKLVKISGINPAMLPDAAVDEAQFQDEKRASSEKSRTHWMAENAKPAHDPESDSHKALIKRLLKKQQNRVGA